jgi:Cft2 family RNA processing exonuclease
MEDIDLFSAFEDNKSNDLKNNESNHFFTVKRSIISESTGVDLKKTKINKEEEIERNGILFTP